MTKLNYQKSSKGYTKHCLVPHKYTKSSVYQILNWIELLPSISLCFHANNKDKSFFPYHFWDPGPLSRGPNGHHNGSFMNAGGVNLSSNKNLQQNFFFDLFCLSWPSNANFDVFYHFWEKGGRGVVKEKFLFEKNSKLFFLSKKIYSWKKCNAQLSRDKLCPTFLSN